MTARRHERPLGLVEIADLFGVGAETPQRWRYRRRVNGFPEPDGFISRNVPYWWEDTVVRWGRATGRTPRADRLEREELRREALREAEERQSEAAALRARADALRADADRAERDAAEALARAGEEHPLAV